MTPKDGDDFNTTTIYHAEGDSSGNDSRIDISATPQNEAAPDDIPPLEIERTITGGATYVNLHVKDTPYEDIFNLADGWWRYDDLRAQVGSVAASAALDTFVSLPLPSKLPVGGDLITSVEELDGETIDGNAMRVFDIELNALQLMLQQSPVIGAERAIEILKQADLLAASDLRAAAKLWIGAEDGQVYRLEGQSESILPYLSSGHEADFPYNLHTTSSVSFSISLPETPVEISAPTKVHE